jgi:hypothetical protein
MAAKKQTGAAKINDNIVTYKEPRMKGRNPNFPEFGDQSRPPISSGMLCISNIG